MKKILLSLFVGLLAMAGLETNAQVVGFVTFPSAARGSLEIGLPDTASWGMRLDTMARQGRMVVARSAIFTPPAPGVASGDSMVCGADTLLTNAAQVAGRVAIVYRGVCEFGFKALAAQRAGAVAVIVVNNANGVAGMLGGVNGINVTIPVIMISPADGARLRTFIDSGDSTNILIGQKRGMFANDFGFGSSANLIRPTDWSVPHTQAERPGDYVIKLGGEVSNFGTGAQTNVNLNIRVDFTNPSGATSTIYNQTGTLAALAVDSTSLITTPDLDLHATGKGRYTIRYEATSPNTDEFDADNVITETLVLSDSIFSKSRVDSLGRPLFSGGIRPSAATAYDFGIWFYAARGHRVKVDKVNFAFVTNPGFNLINETVQARVQQWIDIDLNGLIDPGELLEMGEGFYQYTDSLGSNSVRQTEITDINTGQPGVLLDSNGVYMISVAYTGTQTGIFTCVDPAVDYTLSSDIYQQYISPSFNGTNWFPAGFGAEYAPAISAVTSTLNTSVENVQRNDMNIRVFPNPARDDVYVRLSSESMIGKVNYEVMDITGRVVMSGEKMIDGMNDQINLSVASLQQGVYTVVTKTAKGFNSSRFVVTK